MQQRQLARIQAASGAAVNIRSPGSIAIDHMRDLHTFDMPSMVHMRLVRRDERMGRPRPSRADWGSLLHGP